MRKRSAACVARQTLGSEWPASPSAGAVSTSCPNAERAATSELGMFSSSLIFITARGRLVRADPLPPTPPQMQSRHEPAQATPLESLRRSRRWLRPQPSSQAPCEAGPSFLEGPAAHRRHLASLEGLLGSHVTDDSATLGQRDASPGVLPIDLRPTPPGSAGEPTPENWLFCAQAKGHRSLSFVGEHVGDEGARSVARRRISALQASEVPELPDAVSSACLNVSYLGRSRT